MPSALPAALPAPPSVGALVRVRSRQYLVEERIDPPAPSHATLVRMSCLDDDAQGEPLAVLWEHELDAEVVAASWEQLGTRPFDPPNLFAAYLHALRWNCVTATNPRLFQSPWRAGIEVMAYQLEPLRKALLLPRVNLFIADDVGLGKTIEAGLVLRELLMRQKVRKVIVAAPPSVIPQWRDELEQRFGLPFIIYDREFVARIRRERGYGTNPFTTHTRFLISHALLRDEEYATPLRDWLGDFDPGALLILDEAHHAAPASSTRYAIDSHFTRAVRDLARRFEHRLFLSATPHNGLSNSFSALMEILDPQRFCRGVPIDPRLRDTVMVRRLKSDLRAISGGFPERKVVQIDLAGLPADTPELVLSRLLDKYWALREQRLATLSAAARAAQGLVLINLQKRLLSSIEAFVRTLRAHRRSMERRPAAPAAHADSAKQWQDRQAALEDSLAPDDDRAELDEAELAAEEDQTIELASAAARTTLAPTAEELELLAQMETLAEASRARPDARVRWLIDWLRRELCPGTPGSWQPRRVILFTEYADTKRYLEQQLRAALVGTDRGSERIATFHGGMPDDLREEVKRAFNADPAKHPLRILIATDAAREGVNLQNHCADLFHIDLPWNPSRLEQRNGRIDRKLQRQTEVRCHYFLYAEREADRVLEILVQRTHTIQKELGTFPPVLEDAVTRAMARGIAPTHRRELAESLRTSLQTAERPTVEAELESARQRTTALQEQIDGLREILDTSKKSLDLNEDQLRDVLSSALYLLGADPLRPLLGEPAGAYAVPALDRRPGADPTWAETMDTLRAPRARATTVAEWRQQAPIRPVIFHDSGDLDDKVVHLHLEHRLVQRLLSRFLAQGFLLDDLSRGCVGHTADAIPRVLLLGRLSLYGDKAARLHDEVVALAARFIEPALRKEPLRPYAEDAQEKSWNLLLDALAHSRRGPASVPVEVQHKLLGAAPRDVRELLPALEDRCDALARRATAKLRERGEREAKEMSTILAEQRVRIERELAKTRDQAAPQQLTFAGFSDEEKQQLSDNTRYWESRLKKLAQEVDSEPARIQRSYVVCAQRVEPVGIAYLWPVTG
jgi:superfamily II DNA/RNA helicase